MLEGGCLCGKIRYRVEGATMGEAVCHCRNCQRQGGSAFSVLVAVAAEALRLEGAPALYVDRGDSGGAVHRFFCADCGSPIYSALPDRPAVIYVKAGTIDEPKRLAPKMHVWCDSAWDAAFFAPDAVRVPRNPG